MEYMVRDGRPLDDIDVGLINQHTIDTNRKREKRLGAELVEILDVVFN